MSADTPPGAGPGSLSTAPVPAAPRPRPSAPRPYHFPRFTRTALDNGLRLLCAPVHKLPLVTVTAVIEAGAAVEPTGREGVASLTARALLEGAAGLDGAALAERFESLGASVSASAGWDVALVTVTALASRLPETLTLLRDILCEPSFPAREVDRLRDERLAELLQQRTEPGALADAEFARAVFADSARYARNEDGDTDTVRALTRDDVVAFYRARFRPGGVAFVFAGDIEEQAARRLTEQLFGRWAGAPPSGQEAGVDAPAASTVLRVVPRAGAPQSEVRVGHVGLPRSTPDYFDVTVMNAVLGGLFSSRINLNLREAHGFTYGAFSTFAWRRGAGPFAVSTAVKTAVTADAVREILREIDRIRAEPITTDELTLATSYLDGVFPIRYETTASIASALAALVIHDLPDDYYDGYRAAVRAVSVESVHQAARRHLDPARLHVVIVGDPAVIAAPLSELAIGRVEIADRPANGSR